MKERLIVEYAYIKTLKLEERTTPKKYTMTSENREKLECMNEVLTELIDTITIKNMTELNALHFATAFTLAGAREIKPSKPKTELDPNKFIHENISKMRKWIGRLTAVSKGSKLTTKVKNFLKKDKVEVKLHRLKMKLAALCKKLKTRKAFQKRFQSNKLYKNNQKAFYSTLRNEDGAETTNPPTPEDIQEYWDGLFGNKDEHNKEAE